MKTSTKRGGWINKLEGGRQENRTAAGNWMNHELKAQFS